MGVGFILGMLGFSKEFMSFLEFGMGLVGVYAGFSEV